MPRIYSNVLYKYGNVMIKLINKEEEAIQLHNLLKERDDIITIPNCLTIQANSYYAFKYDNKVIGGFTWHNTNKHLCELKHFIVDKHHRRKGIGREMVRFIKKELTKRGHGKLMLTIRKENKVAQLFFEKCGFIREGFLKDHYRKGGDIYIYGMDLEKSVLHRLKERICYIIE